MPDGVSEQQLKRGRKYAQVLTGARDIFMRDGFEGASVDDIAKAASVSKATLYSYFPNKRQLFMEVATTECRRQADQAIETIDMTAPVQEVLREIATQMVNFLTSDFGLRTFRICVGESERFPDLGREFYENGPAVVRHHIASYLEIAVQSEALVIDDVPFAAEQFSELCKADLLPRILFSVTDTFTAAEKSRVINGAVTMFMRCYGAPDHTAAP